ncbi:hypothetical protein [Fibrella arboris]|uniref:hypothetical protein n=1 Tax=Fibrella arboris TaxID=3242486 RepID=UPI003522B5C0
MNYLFSIFWRLSWSNQKDSAFLTAVVLISSIEGIFLMAVFSFNLWVAIYVLLILMNYFYYKANWFAIARRHPIRRFSSTETRVGNVLLMIGLFSLLFTIEPMAKLVNFVKLLLGL